MLDHDFDFLLNDPEYRVVHVEPGQKSRCVMILEGASVRVRLQTTRDEELSVLIGDLHAPLGRDESVGHTRDWHSLTGIAGYINRGRGLGERFVNMTREKLDKARATAVTALALMLSGFLGRIEALLSDGRFEELRGDYEELRPGNACGPNA